MARRFNCTPPRSLGWLSSSTLEKLAHLNAFLVNMPKNASTRLSQEAKGRSVMEYDLGMAIEPFAALLMDAAVVHYEVDFLAFRQFGNDSIELEKLHPPFPLEDIRVDDARRHLQSAEQIDGSMASIGAFNAPDNLAELRHDPAVGPFKRLNACLLADRERYRVLRGVGA